MLIAILLRELYVNYYAEDAPLLVNLSSYVLWHAPLFGVVCQGEYGTGFRALNLIGTSIRVVEWQNRLKMLYSC
jgi:hypothetical protein